MVGIKMKKNYLQAVIYLLCSWHWNTKSEKSHFRQFMVAAEGHVAHHEGVLCSASHGARVENHLVNGDGVGLPYKDKKLFSQYSLGMKQRLAIALAVMHDPELLILDEPINGLDPIGIAEVRSFIRELCDARGKTILISSHILSEISLLADDIGIIDHGALLEEESLAELEQKSSKHIRFTLSDTAQAARILERNFHENHFSIQDDHNLRLHNLDLPVGKIVTAFVENGLEVSEAHTCEESLEDYFKRVTGGEGIA